MSEISVYGGNVRDMGRKVMSGDCIGFMKGVNLMKLWIGIWMGRNMCGKRVFGLNG